MSWDLNTLLVLTKKGSFSKVSILLSMYGTLENRITFEYTNSQVQGGTGEKVVQLRPEVTLLSIQSIYSLLVNMELYKHQIMSNE